VTIAVLGLNAVLALAAVAVSMQPTLLPEVLAATAVGLALLWFRVVRLAPRPN
jgi:hypothetical protein